MLVSLACVPQAARQAGTHVHTQQAAVQQHGCRCHVRKCIRTSTPTSESGLLLHMGAVPIPLPQVLVSAGITHVQLACTCWWHAWKQ
jgi:hypothetical protein